MTFFYWFHLQLVTHQITKVALAEVTGLSQSTMKNANLKNQGSKDDFNALVEEAMHTYPEYQYAINRLEKQQ